MNCHTCGVTLPPGAQFCPGCRAKVAAAKRTYADDLCVNLRRLSWSFAASLLSFVAVVVFAFNKHLVISLGPAAFVVWIILIVSGISFYVFLGILAVRMKRSPIVWVGTTFVFTPIGPFVAYYDMWRLVRKVVKASKNDKASPG